MTKSCSDPQCLVCNNQSGALYQTGPASPKWGSDYATGGSLSVNPASPSPPVVTVQFASGTWKFFADQVKIGNNAYSPEVEIQVLKHTAQEIFGPSLATIEPVKPSVQKQQEVKEGDQILIIAKADGKISVPPDSEILIIGSRSSEKKDSATAVMCDVGAALAQGTSLATSFGASQIKNHAFNKCKCEGAAAANPPLVEKGISPYPNDTDLCVVGEAYVEGYNPPSPIGYFQAYQKHLAHKCACWKPLF